ncbi:hypothetical protein LTR39_006113, partial [Cryomyces antarcticus]
MFREVSSESLTLPRAARSCIVPDSTWEAVYFHKGFGRSFGNDAGEEDRTVRALIWSKQSIQAGDSSETINLPSQQIQVFHPREVNWLNRRRRLIVYTA